jgi:type I restriction enzyme S subunit
MKLRNNWSIKKIGEVIELCYGKGISRYERKSNGKYPVYGANGILDYSNKFLVEGDAVIIGRKGSAGEITRVSGKFWPSDVTYYVFGNEKIDIDYLFYLLKSLNLPKLAVGVKPGINRNRVYEVEIPLPPLSEQKRIVKRIEKLFAKIDEAEKLREESQKDTTAFFPLSLKKIFEENRKKFNSKDLGEIANLVRGPFGGSLRKDIFVSSGYSVYEQGNVIKNNLENFRYFITSDKFSEMSRFSVKPNDILMSCSGTIGKIAVISEEYSEGIINQALLKITPSEKVTVEYLKYALKDYISQHMLKHTKGSAIKNVVAVALLKKIKIPLPSLSEQKNIVAELDALSEKSRKIEELQKQTAQDFKSLRQSILHQAFSGKL